MRVRTINALGGLRVDREVSVASLVPVSAAWLSSFPLDGGRRSDAYHLVFRADDRSLTTDEVNGWVARVVATVAEFGGTLRA